LPWENWSPRCIKTLLPGLPGVAGTPAWTIVGLVEEDRIITGKGIQPGDVLIGLASNGLHTNGYTLARKVLLSQYQLEQRIPELGTTLVEELLKVHINYFPEIQAVTEKFTVHGIAHITGGGIEKNTARLLPKGLRLAIQWDAWPRPPIFQLIQQLGNVPEADMRQTFNLGIGLVFVVPPNVAHEILQFLQQNSNWPAYSIGTVESI